MADPWLSMAAGCALLSANTVLSPSQDGLIEQLELVVENIEQCDRLALELPAGVTVVRSPRGHLK